MSEPILRLKINPLQKQRWQLRSDNVGRKRMCAVWMKKGGKIPRKLHVFPKLERLLQRADGWVGFCFFYGCINNCWQENQNLTRPQHTCEGREYSASVCQNAVSLLLNKKGGKGGTAELLFAWHLRSLWKLERNLPEVPLGGITWGLKSSLLAITNRSLCRWMLPSIRTVCLTKIKTGDRS